MLFTYSYLNLSLLRIYVWEFKKNGLDNSLMENVNI